MDKERFAENGTRVQDENDNNARNDTSTHSWRYNLIMTLIIVATLAFVFTFRNFVIERIIVSGESMMPNFQNENVVFIKKFNNEFERFDVVVVRENGKLMIKRIIGLPNETIQIKSDGYIYINGELLDDKYGYPTEVYGCVENELKIGTNEYFVMGDNRNHSNDSRAWGAIEESQIRGEVFVRIFPYWEFTLYE